MPSLAIKFAAVIRALPVLPPPHKTRESEVDIGSKGSLAKTQGQSASHNAKRDIFRRRVKPVSSMASSTGSVQG